MNEGALMQSGELGGISLTDPGDRVEANGAGEGVGQSIPSFGTDNNRVSCPLADLDVEVRNEDFHIGGTTTLPEIQFSDRVHDEIDAKLAFSVVVQLLAESSVAKEGVQRNPDALYGPWMQVNTRRGRYGQSRRDLGTRNVTL
ncbi:hypothetical protein V6N13_059133 [Hibiscus sabdariffa]